MEVRLISDVHLKLTSEEFRLISKALRCNLNEEEKLEAKELQDKMVKARLKLAKQHAESLDCLAKD